MLLASGALAAESRESSGIEPSAPSSGSTARGYLNPGFLFSWGGGNSGAGVEVSYLHYPSGACGIGAFAQAQAYGTTPRLAAGAQGACSGLGFELGGSYRGPDASLVAGPALHYAVFFSVGIASVAFRAEIPFAPADPARPAPGLRSEVAVTFKIPIRLYGRPMDNPWKGVFGGG